MKDKKREMAEIASILYYEQDKSQNEIAKLMKISRSYVSQLLIYAKNNGVVDININIDEMRERNLREEINFTSQFEHLKQVYIMKSDSSEFSAANIGKFCAPYVSVLINDAHCIGINPGKSVQNLLEKLSAEDIIKSEDKKIVQIMGGFLNTNANNYSQPNEMVNSLRSIIGCNGYYLNAPAVIDDIKLRDSLLNQKDISPLVSLWKSIDLALMGIGVADERSVLFGYMDKQVIKSVLEHQVCGELNMNFFTQDGKVFPLLDDVKMGMEFSDLRNIKSKVVICSAKSKAKALIGALRAGMIDVLFIDSLTADQVEKYLMEGI